MTIQELAHKANVTVRTIRYYVEQGVLPPPRQGRPSEYTEEHLQRLNLIRDLKAQYLPLEEIRELMQTLTIAQVGDMLTRTRGAEARNLSSAADYIDAVLNRTAVREETLKYHTPQAAAASPPPPPSQARAPRSRLFDALSKRAPQPPAEAHADDLRQEPGLFHNSPLPIEETTWRRVALAPGVELHYSEPNAGARADLIVARLLEAARRILEELPEKETEQTR